MNLDTLLNNLFQLIYSNPDKLNIEYSYKDGKKSLKVNGEEQLAQFDVSNVKKDIEVYRKNLELLDDCMFVEVCESIENEIDLKQMDDLLKQESFTKAEANLVYDLIGKVNESIANKIDDRIEELKEIRNNFK